MGESFRFHGDGRQEQRNNPVDFLAETNGHIRQIDFLLFQLIEMGGDMPSDMKKTLRSQIAQHLTILGLSDIRQFGDFKASLQQQIYDRIQNPHIPHNFPDFNRFTDNLYSVLNQKPKETSVGWKGITASEAAEFGQYDWKRLKPRGDSHIEVYTYNIARIMTDPIAYTNVFELNDPISVNMNWYFDNGRHRGLALKTLGEQFITQSGMNAHIPIHIEK